MNGGLCLLGAFELEEGLGVVKMEGWGESVVKVGLLIEGVFKVCARGAEATFGECDATFEVEVDVGEGGIVGEGGVFNEGGDGLPTVLSAVKG